MVGILEKTLSAQIRPPASSVYGIHDPKGVAYLTQLRVGLSKLNFNKFRHNFRDTMNPTCPINDGIEDTEHFLLLCDSFKEHRCNFLTDVNVVLQNSGHSVWSNSFLQLLLYGDESLSYEVNRSVLTLNFTNILRQSVLIKDFSQYPKKLSRFLQLPSIPFFTSLRVVLCSCFLFYVAKGIVFCK